MPKGETSRPYNRKEKQAAAREKQRWQLLDKTLKRDKASARAAISAVRDTPGAKADTRTLAENRTKERKRKRASELQKDFLLGMPADEHRERTKYSKKR
jgi:hypothetical protein